MRPLSAKDIAIEYAKEIGIPPEHLFSMVKILYRFMRDNMESYDHNMIKMDGLGTFFFRVWKIQDAVTECNNVLRRAEAPVHILHEYQIKRDNMIRMDYLIMSEQTRRRDEYEDFNKRVSMGVHIPSWYNYLNKICRCKECTATHNAMQRKTRVKNKAIKLRDIARLQKIKQYEATRQVQ